jgi:hypothetical protein
VNKLIYLSKILLFVSLVLLPTSGILCEPQKAPVNWQLNLKWKDVPLSEISLPDTKIKVLEGYGNASLTLYNSESNNEISYRAEGNIDKCKIYLSEWEEEISEIKGGFTIDDKELKVNFLEGKLKGIPFTAQANINLISPYPFDAQIKAKDVELEEISHFFPALKNYSRIKAPAEAEFNIKGVLPSGPIEGTAVLQGFSLYSVLMNSTEISFVWYDNKIIFRNFSANLPDGTISGEGEIIFNTK